MSAMKRQKILEIIHSNKPKTIPDSPFKAISQFSNRETTEDMFFPLELNSTITSKDTAISIAAKAFGLKPKKLEKIFQNFSVDCNYTLGV
jgi:hypothetical protein